MADDTAAISLAIAMALSKANSNAQEGAKIYFPAGIYVTGTQHLYSKLHFEGDGIDASVILLKNGTNADLLQGSVQGYDGHLTDPASPMNSGAPGGIYSWSLSNLTLDGNKDNQSSGPSYCLHQYGYGYILKNVHIRNGYTGGIESDWNGGGTAPIEAPETQLINIKVYDCGVEGTLGIGIRFGGPHDSQFANVISYGHYGHAFQVCRNATGMQMSNCHSWGMQSPSALACLIESGYGTYSNCSFEGGYITQVVLVGSENTIQSSHIFFAGSYITSLTAGGLQLGQAGGQKPLPGQTLVDSNNLTTETYASHNLIDAIFSLCNSPTQGSVNFVRDGGNYVRALCFVTSAQAHCYGGTPNGSLTSFQFSISDDRADNPSHAVIPDGKVSTGGGVQFVANSQKAMVVRDGKHDVVNINTFNKRFELVNTPLVIYSDLYYANEAFVALGDVYGTIRFAGDKQATIARVGQSVLGFGGTISLNSNPTAQVITTNGTIITAGLGVARCHPSSNVTGVILQPGVALGQIVTVINEATTMAHTITFAAIGSYTVEGSSNGIAANVARSFVWNGTFWYRQA